MQKRTPAAHTLALQISEGEKVELLVTRMVSPGPQNMGFIISFCNMFNRFATGPQRTTFIKLHDMGWGLGKVVWDDAAKKMAYSVHADGTAAWVGPDGVLDRAAVGKKTAYLDKSWKSAA
jgi:hypothetical protein